MRNKNRLIPVVLIVTCLMLLGIPLAGHTQVKVLVNVKAQLSASPTSYSGACPALITFRGRITVNQPTTIQYKFIRSDNAQAPVQTLKFAKAGSQEVSTTWRLGGAALPTYSGWEAIEVISPVKVQSNKAAFRIRCADLEPAVKPEPGGPRPSLQLPDLTIEDIWLNKQCFVVVKARNNGPGTVPDTVWTMHTPDSSAVYLHINGKRWGGETIWHFDPAKNLQGPGGTAILTSNLKVSGTATINATIDSTGKVKEANERNNQMKKKLTCQPDLTVQPGVTAQPGQQVAPVRVTASLGVKPASYSGTCPALITFRGRITVNGPTTVQYKFIRSDNAQAPVQTLKFAKAGSQEVTTTWRLGGASLPTYSGWEAIEVISPVKVQSNKAAFRIRCADLEPAVRPEPGGPRPSLQLPDLTIEDIWLNEQCFVVVKARNNGPGTVPDKVWTEHAPDSSAVYLYINGKRWGGETIWHFDPAKNLQGPGGTAILTSNLKVTGTATIEAVIDHTRKLRETDEKNNAMKKSLTCQPGVTAQPGVIVRPGVIARPGVGKEDCVSFNPATTTVQQIQGSWKVADGTHWMFDFGNNKAEADKTLAIIKHYRMNQSCFVGRPDPSFHYMLISGASPTGAFAGEDCVSFNPATTTVQQIQGDWKVVDGTHWMFSFGANKAEAEQTLAIIKKYGFTRSCFVGRPVPSFTYMRK